MILEFSNQSGQEISEELFTKLLRKLKETIKGIDEQHVELLLTNNNEIQELNKKYRDIDKPTDVLSFAEREIPEALKTPSNLGQIVISLERAKEQAKDINQSLDEELRFLFTHGLLHLLGYDHEKPEDEEIMLKMAYKILGR